LSDESKFAAAGTIRPKVVIERTYRAQAEELWDLWTTKTGFESWWGPEGFRVEVHALEARLGGKLHYDMIADAPEQIEAMKQLGQPTSHETRGRFAEIRPLERLAITHVRSTDPRWLGGQHHPETRLAAHHSIVGCGGALQWKQLVHGPHAGQGAEGHRVLRIDRAPGRPARD
jgi:uncharacterized protein YndB with AHSA1/START domain